LALAALGEQDEASELAAEQLALARGVAASGLVGCALRTKALVTRDEHDTELLREAVVMLEHSPARLEHAKALVDLGASLRRAGYRQDARGPLGEGLALARRCGALALASRAYDELKATGARPRKILRTGVDALTPSEHRIARLASEGMANKEIAQTLFVTVRTVETHLHSAYQKLDIGARSELPRVLSTE
jgi:DNA-binding CsgD family transcriptional regulator